MHDDRELVMRWVRAWTHLRRLDVEQVDGWPLVHVRGPSRDTEIVCFEPSAQALDAMVDHVTGNPRAMLTVIGRDLRRHIETPLPPGVRVDRDDELLMTTTLVGVTPPPLPAGLSPRWLVDGDRATYCVDADRRLAAEGTVGVLGTDAVFDAVETSPDHQRRGLGRHCMATLTAWALREGATAGVLAASADGGRLYRSIGWDPTLSMWSLMGVEA